MEKKKQKEPELKFLTVLFILLCGAVLLGIFVPWGDEVSGYFYALIALWGVITCARGKDFMAVDILVLLYPKGLRKAVKIIKEILMILVFTSLFIIGILGVISQVQAPTYSEILGIPNMILYVMPVVIYPIAIALYIRAIKRESEEK